MTTRQSRCSWIWASADKTVITLTAINELRYNRFQVRRALVIAPKKVAEATWTQEAQRWDHLRLLRFSLVLGTQAQRIKAVNTPADVYVVSRDNVAWLVDYYRHAWPYDMVVLDESSSFKASATKRFKALILVRSRIGRLVALTGTPAPNGLMDLWAQMYLLDGGQRLGKTLTAYRERYFVPDKRSRTQIYTYAPRSTAEAEVHAAIADICISMRAEDYLQLPDRIMDDVPVVLDSAARRAYDRMECDMLLRVDEAVIDAGTAAALTNKLLQLCNGAAYDDSGAAVPIHDCKVEAFAELVEQLHGEHALVFYAYKHDIPRLTAALSRTGLRVRVYSGPRDADDWCAGRIDILLAHPASCAYGLNLQGGGHNVIWFGLTWSLELYQQANARLHRQGQQHPVVIHHLIVQGGMDQDVLAALEGKEDTQEALLRALRVKIDKAKGEKS